MKNVLFATTALVLTAGVASAEVTFSGKADAGIMKATAATGDNAYDNTGDDFKVYSGFDLNFSATTTTDSGISLTMGNDIGGGFIADLADKEVDAQGGTIAANPTLVIGTANTTITIGDDAIDDYYDGDLDDLDIGVTGSMGALSYGVAFNTEDAAATQYSFMVSYAADGVTASYKMNDGNDGKINASYAMGAAVISAEMNLETDVNKVGVAYTAGSATVSLSADDNDDWDASLSYTAGAMTVSAQTDEADQWEASATYNLGGGATAYFGADHLDTVLAGINFTF